MSLEHIRQLRRGGQKPTAVVTVLLGDKPGWMDDDERLVQVRETDDPRFMDWRPLVGLWVVVATLKTQPERTLAVLDGLQAVEAKFFGAIDPSGIYPMQVGAGLDHARVLRELWEALCQ